MPETTPQLMPTEPAPSAVPQAAPVRTVVPPAEQPKKGSGLLWLAIVLGVLILGGSAYFLYTKEQKPLEKSSMTPPSLVTQEGKPNQGFGLSTPTPSATPTITSSDSVTDIEKDLSGTTIESGNSSEFDADLQSLE
ncbi:MAG: hypothetical protein AAB481_04255 [Patescibacteria group bacterium]